MVLPCCWHRALLSMAANCCHGLQEINVMSSEEQGQLRPVAVSCQPTPQPSQSKIPLIRVQPGKAPLLVSTLQQSVDGHSEPL